MAIGYGSLMTEGPPDLTPQELLERIVQLESRFAYIDRQKAEIKALKAEVADLGAAFKSNVADGTDHFKSIYQYLAEIHEQLWPLVRKVFPGSATTQTQIATIMKSAGRPWDEKKPN
jgi:hypothetical protein